MGDKLNLRQSAGAQVVRMGGVAKQGNDLALAGHYRVEHWRMNHETGERYLLGTHDFPNGITDQGKNAILNVYFNGATPHTLHYLGLIDGAGEVLDATDTYDGINAANGWDEFTDYEYAADAAVRAPWNPDDSTTKQVINPSAITFDITGSGVVHGVFAVSGPNAATKADSTASTNRLWSTAPFSGGEVNVVNLDQLKVTYFVNA